MSDDQRRQELGRFLRSRRLRISPSAAGLTVSDSTRRRTKGLRREELAALSGISLPWYTALEQGRDINVSEQVLESLARVLQLNHDERTHLYSLANRHYGKERVNTEKSTISNSLKYLLDQFPLCPAYISDEKMNILAWNELASAVFGSFTTTSGRDGNMIWRMFMLPAYRTLFRDWETLAGSVLGEFRSMYSRNMDDPWYQDLVAELIQDSSEFADWWESYEVQCTDQHPRYMAHPLVGELNFSTLLFSIQESSNQYLTVFTPNLQDGSKERLAKLAATLDQKCPSGIHS